MGQYFVAVNPDADEYVHGSAMGGCLKRMEILHSASGPLDAVAMLLSDPGTGRKRPADMHARGMSGRWIGERCFFVGDGAYREELKPWPWRIPEQELYERMIAEGTPLAPKLVQHVARAHGMAVGTRKTKVRDLDENVQTYSTKTMVPLIIRDDALDVEEPVHEGYAAEHESARKAIRGKGPSDYLIDARDGQRRLVADMDRREYVDPRHMAEHPTLLGMLRAMGKWWDPQDQKERPHPPSALMLMGQMLFPAHGERDGITARWRGDRVVITAETSAANPTTIQIEKDRDWRDITPELLARFQGIEWPHYHRQMHRQIYGMITE